MPSFIGKRSCGNTAASDAKTPTSRARAAYSRHTATCGSSARARAIVNKPKIIFLDEATSALDNRTQQIVSESMDRMDATRIVIAHRLSTIINADKICYLEAGQIIEQGTYQELMEKDGAFAALAKRQMV